MTECKLAKLGVPWSVSFPRVRAIDHLLTWDCQTGSRSSWPGPWAQLRRSNLGGLFLQPRSPSGSPASHSCAAADLRKLGSCTHFLSCQPNFCKTLEVKLSDDKNGWAHFLSFGKIQMGPLKSEMNKKIINVLPITKQIAIVSIWCYVILFLTTMYTKKLLTIRNIYKFI